MVVTISLVAAACIYTKHSVIHWDTSYGNLPIAEGQTYIRCCNTWQA